MAGWGASGTVYEEHGRRADVLSATRMAAAIGVQPVRHTTKNRGLLGVETKARQGLVDQPDEIGSAS